MKAVTPKIDWQVTMLADKVLKRAMTLKAASMELDDWPRDAKVNKKYQQVHSKALIVSHALNNLLKRVY
ncbi:MAG: hypothetical protein OSB69_14745 [Alphaproteobacteria bacterium]|nr:hypothetical protein [Alphaproteobacteria bacterium]